VIDVDANLSIEAHAQVNYQSTIIQSGAALEIANWWGQGTHTALDLLGGARYWNQDLNASVNLKGNLMVDVTAEGTFDPRDVLRTVLRNRGFTFNRRRARLIEGSGGDVTVERTVQVDVTKAVSFASANDLEWVDPFVGFRVRHAIGSSKELNLEGDVGGFGARQRLLLAGGRHLWLRHIPMRDAVPRSAQLSRARRRLQRERQVRQERARFRAARADYGCNVPLVGLRRSERTGPRRSSATSSHLACFRNSC
jgi:hypothetical protein